ncbi:hypothetical protein [Parabacteroides sp.]
MRDENSIISDLWKDVIWDLLLIKEDNSLPDDKASKLISVLTKLKLMRLRSVYELPASFYVKISKKRWLNSFIIRSFFKSCREVVECDWDFVWFKWEAIEERRRWASESEIKTDCCTHTLRLTNHLSDSINIGQYRQHYEQLSFYWVTQDVLFPASKRLGRSYGCTKVYAYCPVCQKIFCIGGFRHYDRFVNLIEYTWCGSWLVSKANREAWKRCDSSLRLCYRGICDMIWGIKEDYLRVKYNIIWYPPLRLDPHGCYNYSPYYNCIPPKHYIVGYLFKEFLRIVRAVK